jgi:hypothetical protein
MNDDDLIRLFVELTGASEEQARSVLIHLDLYRYLPVPSTASRQQVAVSAGFEAAPIHPKDENARYENRTALGLRADDARSARARGV